jgi:hypothetical protein
MTQRVLGDDTNQPNTHKANIITHESFDVDTDNYCRCSTNIAY